MPKLTDASAQARRDEIVAAAVRVMGRNGVAHTSMADISAESGLSSGSIYSHFASKGEITAQAADAIIGRRAAGVFAAVESGQPLPPREVLALMLSAMGDEEVPVMLVVQLWGEAAVDPEIRAVVHGALERVRKMSAGAILPWVRATQPDLDEAAAERRADQLATSMVGVAQGYIARRALFPDTPSFLEYAEGAHAALG
ncbi:TetR/AcrR family transcriptional regulator [Microbacterium terricola]|uniref:TetR/AcrR family transcriptional regulator n=1 Tax=Microbacterium terricola TaxID=344163 RepID=UPI0021E8196C|nr:TetR family transcriptional regulator [Microbacterium terricola]UYK40418.1 TetR family transcriptional regulator [Microbacterium terricola]